MVTTPNVRAKFAVVLNPNLILKHSQTAGMLIAPLMRKNRISIKKNHNMRLTLALSHLTPSFMTSTICCLSGKDLTE